MPKKNYKQSQDHIIKRLQVQSLKLKDYSKNLYGVNNISLLNPPF